jgi:hypothetical protein
MFCQKKHLKQCSSVNAVFAQTAHNMNTLFTTIVQSVSMANTYLAHA